MMRFKSLDLSNYIGIANGMGLHHINIDFTRCKNKITMIKGDNGSGKSTLFKALQILPDSSDMFIPGMDARKIIEIFDDDTSTIYTFKFEHTAKKDKGYTTKGYIYKTFDGQTISMNENGNISSCKDLIYSELNLDANFIALSQLSADDKGLASKTPAERKRFVSNILQTLEVYNAIHKTISKRASTFKSIMNATVSKIDRLGDENLLNSSLLSITNRIANIKAKKENELQALGSQKSTILQLDPTGSIQDTYRTLNDEISSLSGDKTLLNNKISIAKANLGMGDITSDTYDKIREAKYKIQAEISSSDSYITSLLSSREAESNELQSKISRLKSLQNETNYLTMNSLIQEYKEKIQTYEQFFKEMGLRDFTLTKDEYIIGLNTLKDIKDTVDVFKDSVDYESMQIALSQYIPTGTYPDQDTLSDEISNLEIYLQECKEKLIYYNGLLQVSKTLDMRPARCKIDTCDFIRDAVEAIKQDPVGNIASLEYEISGTQDILGVKQIELNKAKSIIACINYFKVLFRNIDNYSPILNKLPNGDIFSNKDKFIQKLLSGSTFEEINHIYPYVTQASIVEDYNKITVALKDLLVEAKIYEGKNGIIKEIQADIDSINNKVNSITIDIEKHQQSIYKLKEELSQYTYKEIEVKTLLDLYAVLEKLDSNILEKHKNLKTIETSISSIQMALTQIDIIASRINQINNDLTVLERDKSEIEHAVKLLEEYKAEVQMYSAKYEKIDTVKFYSSYNTGVQTVFMMLYMHKVNQIANNLLSFALGGRFSLKKWVIDENEFRIPCLGDGGYLNDDISSLSGGESAIVSTIISLSLLYQASSKFNIPKLDEVDATLDTTNRRQFIIIYDHLMDILKARQSIMISHNDELNLDNADIIILRMDDINKYNETKSVGNVIFDFREMVM